MLQKMQLYLVRFTLPDGKHIAAARSKPIENDKDAAFVRGEVERSFHSTNPDVVVTEIRPVNDPMEIVKAVEALKAEDPERPLAGELGLDTPNRLITDPEIARNLAAILAAQRTPG